MCRRRGDYTVSLMQLYCKRGGCVHPWWSDCTTILWLSYTESGLRIAIKYQKYSMFETLQTSGAHERETGKQ